MNFLDSIWLIPLFPLFGAALMLLTGRKLDPQPPSEVALAPGVEHVHDGLRVLRRDLHSRVLARGRSTADQQRDFQPLAFHLGGEVDHLVE